MKAAVFKAFLMLMVVSIALDIISIFYIAFSVGFTELFTQETLAFLLKISWWGLLGSVIAAVGTAIETWIKQKRQGR